MENKMTNYDLERPSAATKNNDIVPKVVEKMYLAYC